MERGKIDRICFCGKGSFFGAKDHKADGICADKPNEAGKLRRQGVLVFKYLLLITCAVCLATGPASARKAEERWGDLPYPEDSQVVGTL